MPHPPGHIRDAIIGYLQVEGCTASVQEIFDGVVSELGDFVSPSSVRSYLRLNVDRLFFREARGRYGLMDASSKIHGNRPRGGSEADLLSRTFRFKDCLLAQDDCISWLERRAPNSIEAIVTDPPYGLVEYRADQQEKLRNGRGGVWRIPPSFDGHKRAPLPRFTTLNAGDRKALYDFFVEWARVLLPVLVPGANVVVASNPLLSHIVSNSLAEAGLERRGEIVRLVMTMRGGDRPKNAHTEFSDVSVMPRSMWEPWLIFRKPIEGRVQDNLRKWRTGGFRRKAEDRPFGDVIRSHPTRKAERAIAPHPNLKPQAFLREIVRAVLPLGEGTILDPFAGSGSTISAAMAVGYNCIGIERDPTYVRLAQQAIIPLSKFVVRSSE